MGHRANFVIIQHGAATVYYDHWAALGCVHWFAAGPDRAREVLEEEDLDSGDRLFDWSFAEGGYLVDFDLRKAIVFGELLDEDFAELEDALEGEAGANLSDLEDGEANKAALEQEYLAFLQEIAPQWTGWLLQWDERGVDAFAAHLHARGMTTVQTQPPEHPADSIMVEYPA